MATQVNNSVGQSLKYWRRLQNMSQFDLALEADVSTRHISFIENGKTHPTRDMLLKLGQAMQLTPSQQNSLLVAGGYIVEDPNATVAEEEKWQTNQLLFSIVEKFEPYPAVVIDAKFNVMMMNEGFRKMAKSFGTLSALEAHRNLIRSMFGRDGFYAQVENFLELRAFALARLQESVGIRLDVGLQTLLKLVNSTQKREEQQQKLPAISPSHVPLVIRHDGRLLRFLVTLLMVGTPIDAVSDDGRIALLVPANLAAEMFCKQVGLDDGGG